MRETLRSLVNRVSPAQTVWVAYRRSELHRQYEARREHYAKAGAERRLVYIEKDVIESVRARLAARGATPTRRAPGQIHTFAFVPGYSWHAELLPDLRELGRLTVFDYRPEGFEWHAFARADASGIRARAAMNERVFAALRAAHAVQPVDWVFVYGNGIEVSATTIRRVTKELGIPTVNMCLDDKQSWVGPWMGDHRGGQIDLAGAFDLSWTSARVACGWYLVEGARPIYMPEGFDGSTYHPLAAARDLAVSFVGGAYGRRPRTIRWLREHGIPVRVFGDGWPDAEPASNLCEIANRSAINLGMGEIGYSETLTNVKGRDFQIPGAGGGVYLTSFNADLAQHFAVGREILCYRGDDEMLEQIRYFLARPVEASEIAERGRMRALAEHRWLHRYWRVCEILGILNEGRGPATGCVTP